MSVEAMALVLHHSKASGTDKVVLLGIANHAGDGGAWPTVETLARYANVTERAVQKCLHKLVQLGELTVHRQAGGTRELHAWHRPNRYDVLIACPATCDHTANHRPRKLPTAPAELWTDGVNHGSPGEPQDTRGVNHRTPGGVNHGSPKPSIEPSTYSGSAYVSGPRASCSVCSLPAAECIKRAGTSGHAYTPAPRDPAAVAGRVVQSETEDCVYAYGCQAALHLAACPEHPDHGGGDDA